MSKILEKINKRKNSGGIAWGDKDQKYLEKTSRESVENHNDMLVLYLQVDYERSHRNFYGELLHKEFMEPVPLKGIAEIEQEEISYDEAGIISKGNNLKVGFFIEHLKELGVDPLFGDFFFTKNKFYLIWDKTALDANETSVAYDRATTIKFEASEAADEEITIDPNYNNHLNTLIQTFRDAQENRTHD